MTRGSVGGQSFVLGAVCACGPCRSALIWHSRLLHRLVGRLQKVGVGVGGAPVWQRGWPAVHLRLVFALEAGKVGPLGRRSGGSGWRTLGWLSGKPRSGGVGRVLWSRGRHVGRRLEFLARSGEGAVSRPDFDLEALLQPWCPLPFAVAGGVGDPCRWVGGDRTERKLKPSLTPVSATPVGAAFPLGGDTVCTPGENPGQLTRQ